MVSGFTQIVAVIGHPSTQVKSPDNFNHYFASQNMDKVMIPVDIAPEAVADYLNTLRGWHNMSGILVTVPHKQRVAGLLDVLTPRARHLNAVNCVRKLPDGRLEAAGKRALLSGCGGVGSAIAWGLCEAGIDTLALYDRDDASRQRLANRLATHFPTVHLTTLPTSLAEFDLLGNGSPAGMAGFDSLPLTPELLATLTTNTHVADVVTAPVITPLLAFARERGCRTQTGPEMALAQMHLMGEFIGALPQPQEATA